MKAKIFGVLVVSFLLMQVQLSAQDLRMNIEDWKWNRRLVDVEHVPAEQTAQYDSDGQKLTVGPWIAGKHDVRLVYQGELPLREGTISGQFRTNGLYPREANIWISYKKGEKTVTELNYWLGQTEEWTDFCFPVFPPLEGCDCIQVSFGFHMKTHGSVELRGLSFGEPLELPKRKGEPLLTRKLPPAKASETRYPTLDQSDGTWWLRDAQGNPFFSLGCAMYGNRISPHVTYPDFHELGFNTVANGSNLADWKQMNDSLVTTQSEPVFQFYRVDTQLGRNRKYDGLMNAEEALRNGEGDHGESVGGFNHALPDPFDPRWVEDVRRQVREMAGRFRDKPYFMGWMAANERSHWNLYRYVWSPCCAREFDTFLRARYTSIAKLNEAWGTSFASFEDLQQQRPEPEVIEGRKYEDFNEFSRRVLRTVNTTVLRIIREEDPGRLVFSNRFMIHEVRGVMDNLDLYEGFDGIAVNLYPSNVVWGLDMAERQYFELLHEKTGLPLMICEWSVPARDSHLYDNPNKLDWSYPQLMRTQKDRAEQSAQVLADFYNMPFVVGAHWFTWGDFKTPVRQSNRGLYSHEGNPWKEVQKALQRMNERINKLVRTK